MTTTSGVEFLVWLLIVAAIIAMFAKRLRIPYTVSLVRLTSGLPSAPDCKISRCSSRPHGSPHRGKIKMRIRRT